MIVAFGKCIRDTKAFLEVTLLTDESEIVDHGRSQLNASALRYRQLYRSDGGGSQ